MLPSREDFLRSSFPHMGAKTSWFVSSNLLKDIFSEGVNKNM